MNLNQAGFPSSKKDPKIKLKKVDPTTILFFSNRDESAHSVQNMFMEMKGEEVWGKPGENGKSAWCRLIAEWSGSERLDWKGENQRRSRGPTLDSCVLHKSDVSFSVFQTAAGGRNRGDVKIKPKQNQKPDVSPASAQTAAMEQ